MEANDKPTYVGAMEADLTRIETELGELETKRKALLQERERLTLALDALGGRLPKPGRQRSAASSKSTKPRGPSLTASEVEGAIAEVRRATPSLVGDDLKAAAQAHLREQGKTVAGFGIHFGRWKKKQGESEASA